MLTSSESFFQGMESTAVRMALCTHQSKREDLEGGSPWLLSQYPKERTFPHGCVLSFRTVRALSLPGLLAWPEVAAQTPVQEKKRFCFVFSFMSFHISSFFKVISVWS